MVISTSSEKCPIHFLCPFFDSVFYFEESNCLRLLCILDISLMSEKCTGMVYSSSMRLHFALISLLCWSFNLLSSYWLILSTISRTIVFLFRKSLPIYVCMYVCTFHSFIIVCFKQVQCFVFIPRSLNDFNLVWYGGAWAGLYTLYFSSFFNISVLSLYHVVSLITALIYNMKHRIIMPSVLFLLLSISFPTLGCFYFHLNFRISSSFMKKRKIFWSEKYWIGILT